MAIEQFTTFSPETADAIRQLAKQIGPNYKPLTDKDVQDMIDSPNTFVFLARDSDTQKIAGMITLIVYRIPYARKAMIEDLLVDDEYRGQGIGSQLLQRAMDEASAKGASYVDLTSQPTRIASNKLYEKFGFKKRETNVYRFVYDEIGR